MSFRSKCKVYAQKRLALRAKSKYRRPKVDPVASASAADLAPREIEIRGAGLAIQDCHEPEILLEGPAGTGKSIAALVKVYACADRYPGARILIIRKVKATLAESILATFEKFVLPENHPEQNRVKRTNRSSYQHINGSIIVCGGLDNPEKLLSTDWDLIYFAEALEAEQEGYETLIGRLRGDAMPYQQIIADCNPGHPRHFLNLRAGAPGRPGAMERFKSKHEDNPRWHDGQKWTEAGLSYIKKLDRMSGARLQRYRYGVWAASQGVIYGEAVTETHWVMKAQVPYHWRRIWGIDFGYSNPFVWHEWAINDDGDLIRVKELYMTGMLVEDAARMIMEATKEDPEPEAVICDHDAEDRATFERKTGKTTTAGFKSVLAGINAVKSRLKVRENGKPRLYFMEGALIHEPDEELLERKHPVSTDDEIPLYEWDEKSLSKDKPVKKFDHGLDVTRMVVCYVDNVEDGGEGERAVLPIPTGVRRYGS